MSHFACSLAGGGLSKANDKINVDSSQFTGYREQRESLIFYHGNLQKLGTVCETLRNFRICVCWRTFAIGGFVLPNAIRWPTQMSEHKRRLLPVLPAPATQTQPRTNCESMPFVLSAR